MPEKFERHRQPWKPEELATLRTLAAFSSIITTAASAVSASGSVPRGRVALVVPSVT